MPCVLKGEKEGSGGRDKKSGSDCRDTACKVALPGLCEARDTPVPAEMINKPARREGGSGNGSRPSEASAM